MCLSSYLQWLCLFTSDFRSCSFMNHFCQYHTFNWKNDQTVISLKVHVMNFVVGLKLVSLFIFRIFNLETVRSIWQYLYFNRSVFSDDRLCVQIGPKVLKPWIKEHILPDKWFAYTYQTSKMQIIKVHVRDTFVPNTSRFPVFPVTSLKPGTIHFYPVMSIQMFCHCDLEWICILAL